MNKSYRRYAVCRTTSVVAYVRQTIVNSHPGHFGPNTFRHHPTGAEVSGQFGTSAEMSRGHFGTGTELSRPPANIFVTTVIQKKGLLVIIINEDH